MKSARLSLVLFFALAGANLRASAAKTPIHLQCHPGDDDAVGSRLCSALRDAIASSPRYVEVTSEKFYFVLHVVSMTTKNAEGISVSAQAVELAAHKRDESEIHLQLSVLVTGSAKVKEQADGILSNADGEIQGIVSDTK